MKRGIAVKKIPALSSVIKFPLHHTDNIICDVPKKANSCIYNNMPPKRCCVLSKHEIQNKNQRQYY